VALKNLGTIPGKEGDSLRALYYLRQSYEIEPRTGRPCTGLARLFAAPGMQAARSTDLARSRACRFSWLFGLAPGRYGKPSVAEGAQHHFLRSR
jgi:hypothetical protein